MSTLNKSRQKRFIIGMTTILIAYPSFVLAVGSSQQASGVTFRLSGANVKKAETGSLSEVMSPEVIAKRIEINGRSLDGLKLNIPQGTRDIVIEEMVTNKGLVGLISSIGRESAANVAPINILRIKIASFMKGIDILDTTQIQRAQGDISFQNEFHIAQLVATMNPRGVSTNTRANVEFFLKEVLQLLESKVPRHEILRLAAESTLASKGFVVDIASISEQATKPDGVMGLFKGMDEQLLYDIGVVDGGVPLTLRMTGKKLAEMEADVEERVKDLVDLASNTQNVQQVYANQALQALNKASDDVDRFMKGNTILNASSTIAVSARSETAKVQTSVGDLLRELQYLGVEIGGEGFKNKYQDVLRSLPVIGKRLAPDRVDRIKTARDQIVEIDKALVAGANNMSANNLQLMKMKGEIIALRIKLQEELARAKMSIELLEKYEKYYRDAGNLHVADVIKQDILLRLQRDFSASLILYGQMAIATASIDAMVAANEIIIANANDIRRVAIQAIAIQETLRIANLQTKQVMLQQKAIQAYLATLTVQNVNLLRENAAMLKEAMSTPMMEAAVIGQAIKDLVEIQNTSRKDRAEAATAMGKANADMIAVVNQINQLNLDPVGAAVGHIMNGERKK